tara:strand:- start:196 stop:528 length:333 start_codon:yes stop_codon:yes gene_type:complete
MIEWTRYSTKEWIGETPEEHTYRIDEEITWPGNGEFHGSKRCMVASVELGNGLYFEINIGKPDSGAGVMNRLKELCERHYQDLLAGKLWVRHQQIEPTTRQWIEPPEDES